MFFNSTQFIFIFAPVIISLFYILGKLNMIRVILLFLSCVSLFYYSIWSYNFTIIFSLSIITNFFMGKLIIINYKKKKFQISNLIVVIAILLNIIFLGFFMYFNFFVDNLQNFLKLNISNLEILLPLGISFFTIKQIVYIIHCNGGPVLKYKNNFLDYLTFITYFPQLIAGPVIHYDDFFSQFKKKILRVNFKNINLGLFLFSIGLFKKCVLADHLAIWTSNGFNNYEYLNFFESWLLTYSYAFQIYFDVSAYADMAIGVSMMLNIKLPINFNSPYKQMNTSLLWKNWHMTVTKFITHYIYMPIVMSFKNLNYLKVFISISLTMILAGLWHGSNWTFIVFGIINGLSIVIYHLWRKVNISLNKYFSIFITFTIFSISLIFFKSDTLSQAFSIILSMFDLNNVVLPGNLVKFIPALNYFNIQYGTWLYNLRADILYLFFILFCFMIIFFFKNSNELLDLFKLNKFYCILTTSNIIISLLFINNTFQYVYFKF